MNEYEYEKQIDILKYQLSDAKKQIEKLEQENKKLSDELYTAKWKIRTELEPRIQKENRVYDRWITNND